MGDTTFSPTAALKASDDKSRAPAASRRKGRWAAAALLVLVAGWTTGWWLAANRLERAVDDWIAGIAQRGVAVAYADRTVVGFPFRLEARLSMPTVNIGPRDGAAPSPGDMTINWRAAFVTVGYDPLAPRAVSLGNEGHNEFVLSYGGARHSLDLHAASTLAVFAAGDGGVRHGRVEIDRPNVTLATAMTPGAVTGTSGGAAPLAASGKAERLIIDVTLRDMPADNHLAPSVETAITLNRLVFDRLDGAPDVAGLVSALPVTGVIEAALMGSLAAGPLTTALPAWRDEGGTVEIRRVDLASDAIGVKLSGTLALDRQMRPLGAASGTIRGFGQVIDRLAASGQIAARDAQLARLMLSAMAYGDPDTGEPTISVPMTAQDGWLNVGPVRLARLRPVLKD